MQISTSSRYYERARKSIAGGVNSPVRAFDGVGGTPLFIARGEGAYVFDVDGNRYLDYVLSWGPLILGHAHPDILTAIIQAAEKGTSFGAPTLLEIELAEKIHEIMPSMERIRMLSSGTEASMSAIRLARGYTKRNKILKFSGCYHGHTDALLVKAGSGTLTFGQPSSAGVPSDFTAHTLVAHYNRLEEVEALFAIYGEDIAAIIVEPIAGNMNCILPLPEFLPGLRKICDRYQSLLIFDEVMTGFRVALSGAQSLYQITPDLTLLGKIVGGGLPAAAYGGKKEIMALLAPEGPVYQAGTLSGNPLAMAAGLATLTKLQQPGFFEKLHQYTEKLVEGMRKIAHTQSIPFHATHAGGMFGFFFNEAEKIDNLQTVQSGNLPYFKTFYHHMLAAGVYFAPSMHEANFMSCLHQDKEIDFTLQAFATALQKI